MSRHCRVDSYEPNGVPMGPLINVVVLYIVVIAVKKRKSNCDVNEKEGIKIVAISKRRKSNCSGFANT
jgi:hypothetical protein